MLRSKLKFLHYLTQLAETQVLSCPKDGDRILETLIHIYDNTQYHIWEDKICMGYVTMYNVLSIYKKIFTTRIRYLNDFSNILISNYRPHY
jgi:hypothetical protein